MKYWPPSGTRIVHGIQRGQTRTSETEKAQDCFAPQVYRDEMRWPETVHNWQRYASYGS